MPVSMRDWLSVQMMAVFERDFPPGWLPFVHSTPLSLCFEQISLSCGGDALQRHKTANVVGQVLQANLGACPHDADRAHDSAARRGLLSSEHVFDAASTFWRLASLSCLSRSPPSSASYCSSVIQSTPSQSCCAASSSSRASAVEWRRN